MSSEVNGTALKANGIDLSLNIEGEETITAFLSYEDLAKNFIDSMMSPMFFEDNGCLVAIRPDEADIAQEVKNVCGGLRYLASYIEEEYGNKTLREFLISSERNNPFGH